MTVLSCSLERFGEDQAVTLIADVLLPPILLIHIIKLIRLVNASVQFIKITGTPSPSPVHCNYISPEQVASPK